MSFLPHTLAPDKRGYSHSVPFPFPLEETEASPCLFPNVHIYNHQDNVYTFPVSMESIESLKYPGYPVSP